MGSPGNQKGTTWAYVAFFYGLSFRKQFPWGSILLFTLVLLSVQGRETGLQLLILLYFLSQP